MIVVVFICARVAYNKQRAYTYRINYHHRICTDARSDRERERERERETTERVLQNKGLQCTMYYHLSQHVREYVWVIHTSSYFRDADEASEDESDEYGMLRGGVTGIMP
jgi:hypothetical protein